MNYQTLSYNYFTSTNLTKTITSTLKSITGISNYFNVSNYHIKNGIASKTHEYFLKQELLNKREKELSSLKDELNKQILSFKSKEEELEEKYIKRVEELRNIVLGDTFNEESNSIQDLKILIIGDSVLNKDDIYRIFNERFIKMFDESLNKKCINASFLNYNNIKNSNIIKKIKKDTYDFIIIGQQPHSIKGKNSNHSYKRFIQEHDLKAEVFEQYNMTINKRAIEEYANIIIEKWADINEICYH